MDIRILFYCCGGWSLVHICRLQKQNLSIVMSWKHCCGNETLWLPSCNLQSSNSSPLWPSIPLFLSNHIRIILICLIETKGTWVVSWNCCPCLWWSNEMLLLMQTRSSFWGTYGVLWQATRWKGSTGEGTFLSIRGIQMPF
jgi:hypothetical protein